MKTSARRIAAGRPRRSLNQVTAHWNTGDKRAVEKGAGRSLHAFYRELVAYAPRGIGGPWSMRNFMGLYLAEAYASLIPPFGAAETEAERTANPLADPAVLHELQRKGELPPNDHGSETFHTALSHRIDTDVANYVYRHAYRYVASTTPGGLPPQPDPDSRTYWSAIDHQMAFAIENYKEMYAEQYAERRDFTLAQKEQAERQEAAALAKLVDALDPADRPAPWPIPAFDPSTDRWRPPPGDWTETIWNPGVTHTLSPRESMRARLTQRGRLDLLEKYDDTPPRFSPRQSRLQMIAPIMLNEDVLRRALNTGVVPLPYRPHRTAFVGDLPPSTLATLVASGAVTCAQIRTVARQLLPAGHPTLTWLATQPPG